MQRIETSYGSDNLGLESREGKHFFFSKTLRPDSGPSLLFHGYWGFLPGVKRPRCEVDHSPSYSVEVKNEWSNTSNPVHGVERDNITVTFTLYIPVDNLECDVAYVLLLLITGKEVYWVFC
jgi:hypothetical protein